MFRLSQMLTLTRVLSVMFLVFYISAKRPEDKHIPIHAPVLAVVTSNLAWGSIESDVDFDDPYSLDDPEISYLEVAYRGITFVVSHLHHEWVTKKEQHVMAALFDAVATRKHAEVASGEKLKECHMLDVGMNDGFFSMMAARLGCRVISFELQEKCIRVARRALTYNGDDVASRVTIVHRPVAEVEDVFMTLPYDRNWCSGRFGFASKNCGERCNPNFRESKTFRSVALQERFMNTDYVFDFVKVDVEGFDPQVMRGALGLFRTQRVKVAVIEIVPGYWHPDANISLTNWAVFDILSFGYSAQCLTHLEQVFSAKSGDNALLWNFVHTSDCVDYRFILLNNLMP